MLMLTGEPGHRQQDLIINYLLAGWRQKLEENRDVLSIVQRIGCQEILNET